MIISHKTNDVKNIFNVRNTPLSSMENFNLVLQFANECFCDMSLESNMDADNLWEQSGSDVQITHKYIMDYVGLDSIDYDQRYFDAMYLEQHKEGEEEDDNNDY